LVTEPLEFAMGFAVADTPPTPSASATVGDKKLVKVIIA
tara:strand:- start:9606 stop:9722 length:117 start_codon:yes stop_codon:yes gene_type:complete